MRRAWTVALLATDVPLGDLLSRHVVVHRMAAVAERTSGTLHLFRRIMRGPPVSPGFGVIRAPDFVRNIPLRRENEVVVADLREVTLLPLAAVNKGHIGDLE